LRGTMMCRKESVARVTFFFGDAKGRQRRLQTKVKLGLDTTPACRMWKFASACVA
jgi:hypothetical protein